MDSGIIIALIFGAASLISSICFGLIPAKRKQKIEKMERKIFLLLKDIDSFCLIESLLLDEIHKATGNNKESTKRDVRKRVRDEKNYTINSTPSSIIQDLTRYENS